MLVKVVTDISKHYLYSLFHFGGVSRNISQSANGTNVLHLKPEVMLKAKITLPNKNILDLFDATINCYFSKINGLLTLADLLLEAKNILLPRLISGQIEIE